MWLRVIVLLALAAALDAQSVLTNPDFEKGSLGAVPEGWFVPSAIASWQAVWVGEGCGQGKGCAEIARRHHGVRKRRGRSRQQPHLFQFLFGKRLPASLRSRRRGERRSRDSQAQWRQGDNLPDRGEPAGDGPGGRGSGSYRGVPSPRIEEIRLPTFIRHRGSPGV